MKSPHLPFGLEREVAVTGGCCRKAECLVGVGTVSRALNSVSCPGASWHRELDCQIYKLLSQNQDDRVSICNLGETLLTRRVAGSTLKDTSSQCITYGRYLLSKKPVCAPRPNAGIPCHILTGLPCKGHSRMPSCASGSRSPL